VEFSFWSKYISRVLSWVIICLGCVLPRASCGLYPKGQRAASSPSYSALLPMGFAKLPHCCGTGGLLHHRFSFASSFADSCYVANPLRRVVGYGGFAFSFLWHFPEDRSPSPLASIVPCGARTFLPDSIGATT